MLRALRTPSVLGRLASKTTWPTASPLASQTSRRWTSSVGQAPKQIDTELSHLRKLWVNDPNPIPIDNEAEARRRGKGGGFQIVTLAARPDLAKRAVAAEVKHFPRWMNNCPNPMMDSFYTIIMENPFMQLLMIEPNPHYDAGSPRTLVAKELFGRLPTTVDELAEATTLGTEHNLGEWDTCFPERIVGISLGSAFYWDLNPDSLPDNIDHTVDLCLLHQQLPGFDFDNSVVPSRSRPVAVPDPKANACSSLPSLSPFPGYRSARGHDGAIPWSGLNTYTGLSVSVAKGAQGTGLASFLVRVLGANAYDLGLRQVYSALRPFGLHKYPLMTAQQWVDWKVPDPHQEGRSVPVDPWIRTLMRQEGTQFLPLKPGAHFLDGTPKQWEEWTGLQFPYSGPYIVPGCLSPIHVDLENNSVRYVEYYPPFIWPLPARP